MSSLLPLVFRTLVYSLAVTYPFESNVFIHSITNREETRHQLATCQYLTGLQFPLIRGNPFPLEVQLQAITRLDSSLRSAFFRLETRISHPRRRRSAVDSTVATSSQPQSLSRRKSASASASSHSSSSQAQISKPTRIVYREALESDSDLPFWQRPWFIAVLFVMAIGFFGLALVLFFSLDSDSYASPAAAASEGVEITYGSVLKLMHEKTKYRLHSHDVPYGSGSGQQSVTSFPKGDDANSYWIVKPVPESSEKQGDTIKSGTTIRLQHMKTRKWLHSHLHASPISGNLEVSCFGGEGNSDTGDYWRVQIEGTGTTWRQDQRVRLQHVDTGGYLHTHNKKYQRIAGGQQEVCGIKEKRPENIWLAAEGVYFPITEGKSASS